MVGELFVVLVRMIAMNRDRADRCHLMGTVFSHLDRGQRQDRRKRYNDRLNILTDIALLISTRIFVDADLNSAAFARRWRRWQSFDHCSFN